MDKLWENTNLLIILKIEKTVVPGFHAGYKNCSRDPVKRGNGVENILNREHELVDYIFSELGDVPNIKILQVNNKIVL
jgi:selenocysteine lyase/cysteine desulfurase